MIAERMRADGALIGGESISLNASGAVRNDGSMHGSRDDDWRGYLETSRHH
jgi:hypothetical protein